MSRDFTLSLKQLTISPENVRAHEDTDTTTLEASLLAHTQLHPLVVREKSKNKYEVIAGRRRFLAFERLVAAKRITRDFPIKVTLAPESIIAGEVSLAENVEREAMHPADEFATFRVLIEDKGLAREDIAERFGITLRHIDRRLKLAKVSAAILDAYRKGDLTLLQVEAFAVTDDHARQDHFLQNAGHLNRQPDAIRRAMKVEAVEAKARLAIFVGEEAYRGAGGPVTRDLFSEETYFDDAALLEQLAQDKLKTIAAEVREQGPWKWVCAETAIPDRYTAYPTAISGVPSPLTPEEEAAAGAIEAEIEAIEQGIAAREKEFADAHTNSEVEVDEAAWSEAIDADKALEALYAEKDAARDRHEATLAAARARPRRFDPDEMQLAGVLVTIDHRGLLDVAHGLLRKEDVKYLTALREKRARIEQERRQRDREAELKARAEAAVADPSHDDADDEALVTGDHADGEREQADVIAENDDAIASLEADSINLEELKASVDSGMSDPLHLAMNLNSELSYHLTLALRAELIQQPDIALRLLAYAFALSILSDGYMQSCTLTDLRIASPYVPKELAGMEAAAIFAEERELLRNRMPENGVILFDWIMEIDRAVIDQIIALGFAETVNAHIPDKSPYTSKKLALAHRLMQVLALDMGRWWQSDETFFKRAGKKVTVRALTEAGPLPRIEDAQMRDMEVAALMQLKTAELADRAAHDLQGTGWLPHLLRTPGLPFNSFQGTIEDHPQSDAERDDGILPWEETVETVSSVQAAPSEGLPQAA